jgi:hypothetical protein
VIGVLVGELYFPAGLNEQPLGTFRVTAQLVVVCSLRHFEFFISFGDMLLRFGEIRVTSRIDIYLRPLGEGYSDEYEANSKRTSEVQAFPFHVSVSLCRMESKAQSRVSLGRIQRRFFVG